MSVQESLHVSARGKVVQVNGSQVTATVEQA